MAYLSFRPSKLHLLVESTTYYYLETLQLLLSALENFPIVPLWFSLRLDGDIQQHGNTQGIRQGIFNNLEFF